MDMIKKRMAMRGQSGFTLVELLVAVAILAILAGVAVFAVGNLTSDAGVSACRAEKDTLVTANTAANASSSLTDTYTTNLGSNTPKYFTASVAPAAGDSNARVLTLTATSANQWAGTGGQCTGGTFN